MNIKQIEKEIVNRLTNVGIELNEAKVEAKMLIKHVFDFSNSDFLLKVNEVLDEKPVKDVLSLADIRATTKRPIQHIIGTAYFMGEDFIVNENVLIPRDETEILVRKALEILNAKPSVNISTLDIGTGSGCIACMVAKNSESKVLGVDISTDALSTALDNASKLGLCNKAIFRKSDIFSSVRNDEKFDVIISNPPYIPESEMADIQAEVSFEPKNALYAKNNGLEFYQKIAQSASEFLKEDGYLMFELGINQSDTVKKMMEESGFKNIEIIEDLAYIKRVILGKRG